MTRAGSTPDAILMMNMSHSKKRRNDSTDTDTEGTTEDGAQSAETNYADPSAWVGQAEAFARREPVKAVASAVGAGFLVHLLPMRAILGALIAVAFALARPTLLFLGLLKAWDLCPCKKEPKI